MRSVIYSAHQPYAVRAAEIALADHGWRPVYWLCRPEQMQDIRARFGEEPVLHSYLDAVRGKPADAFARRWFAPFDPARLDPGIESIALSMLDRNDSYADAMTYRERVDYVLGWLGYWAGIFGETSADTVVFEEVPHQATDFLLYSAAKSAGLLTIVPVRGLPDAGFQANDTIGAACPVAMGARASSAPGARSGTGAAAFLDGMSRAYDAHLEQMFWDHADSVKQIVRGGGRGARWRRLLEEGSPKHALGRYVANLRTFRNDQKVAGASLRESEMSYLEFLRHKSRTLARKSALRETYAGLSTPDPDLSRSYVYCCLQYQPEASTSPLAGRYVQQWLMVEQLAAALPDGWRLYVKEHPSQFSGEYARYGEIFRSRAFYERLLANGRTDLMPLSLDSFTLIDGARAVAGPGGTVCFEAVARGKPAINFGGGFFVGCPGIAQVRCADDVVRAIGDVVAGRRPDAEAVRRFAEALDRATYPGAIGGPAQLDRMGIDVERNAALHVACWLESAQPQTAGARDRKMDVAP